MPVSGNGPAALQAMLKGLSDLAAGEWREDMNRSIGAELVALVKTGFRTSTDPYGKAWPKPKYRNGKPLLRTGRLRNSWAWSAGTTSGQIAITNLTAYAGFIQHGTSRMEARLMFPETDLPPAWAERIASVADLVVKQHAP